MYVIYHLKQGRVAYYFTTSGGWTPNRDQARRYKTAADAEGPLRRMMLDNVKAKVRKL